MITIDAVLSVAHALCAQSATSLDAEPLWRPPLERYIDALNASGRLSPARAEGLTQGLAWQLSRRPLLDRLLDEHPEVREVDLGAPVFITGLPRTGTTLLHNLLSAHPEHHGLPLWALRSPAEAARRDPATIARLTEEARHILAGVYDQSPGFAAVHWMQAERPDECSWAFRQDMRSLVLSFQCHTPDYARWLLDQDMRPAYRRYRRLLQAARWRSGGGRLVLKDPCHLWHLDALMEVFPRAQVVVLSRDPARSVPSFASLCHALQSMQGSHDDREAVGGWCADVAEEGLRRAARARERWPERVVDQAYDALVADPQGAIAALSERLGSAWTKRASWRLEDALHDNPRYAHGRHHYSAAAFGLDEGALRERLGSLLPTTRPSSPIPRQREGLSLRA